jgi:enhanced filamentous growth protein 1
MLYPLFVHNIGGLLYQPENAPRTNALTAATTERRRMDSVDGGRPPSSGGAPALHHHHSMSGPLSGQAPPTPHSISAAANAGRPGIDRAHTFPTPPTSASSVMGMGNASNAYWEGQGMPNGVNGAQPMPIEAGINARSMPTTPATTPPSQSQPNGMQGYQGQPYDTKGSYAANAGSTAGYPPHSDDRYGTNTGYPKTEMGPPPPAPAMDSHDPHISGQGHEHDGTHPQNGYMPPNAAAYGANRSYSYNPVSDHAHLSPELTGSPHQAPSGRGTPRSLPPGQSGWVANDYQTPPRGPASGNVYNAMATTSSSNGPSSDGAYPSSAYSGTGMPSAKRGRDDDDQDRPASREYDQFKRQKTGPARQESFGMPLNAPHMQAIKSGGQR